MDQSTNKRKNKDKNIKVASGGPVINYAAESRCL